MLRRAPIAALVLSLSAPLAAAPSGFPSLAQQLAADRVVAGSALAALVRANQDIAMLRPEEASDRLGLPPWLRIWWRKAHPAGRYRASDPTGGYPRVLHEIHEWMLTHQDLQPGPGSAAAAGTAERRATAATATSADEERISGAQTTPRSESDIRVDPWDPTKVIAAANNIGGSGQQAQLYSRDAGATWGQTYLSLLTGDSFQSDPTVEWTSDGTAWSTTIGISGGGCCATLKLRAYKSTDQGATWTFDATFSGSQTSTDKEMLWADHSPTSPYKDNLYAIWHDDAPVYVNRRTGPAGAWQTPLPVSGAETTGTGIGADIKTNAAGDVFGFWPDTGSQGLFAVKSTDGGVSFGVPVLIATTFASYDIGVPSFNSRRALIYTTGGAWRTVTQNLVYVVWTDLTGASGCTSSADEPGSNTASTCKSRIWFTRSTDGGSTWAAARMLNDLAALDDQFNPWLTVDETTGALAVMYYDTVADPGRKKVDVYYQSSFDDGQTWSAALKITSAPTDETSAGADLNNQFGDYNSLSGYQGVFFPSWTDRRADLSTSREEIWTARIDDPMLGLDFFTLPPCRALDTRVSGSAVAAGSTFPLTLEGSCGIPSGARAVALNVTVVQPAAAGYLTLFPGALASAPRVSTINFQTGVVRANNAVAGLAWNGTADLKIYNGSAGAVNVVVDVTGYFR